jgi:hypothetical protein
MDLHVKVVPKSAKTELIGVLPDGTWKIKVAAAPDKGKANRARYANSWPRTSASRSAASESRQARRLV